MIILQLLVHYRKNELFCNHLCSYSDPTSIFWHNNTILIYSVKYYCNGFFCMWFMFLVDNHYKFLFFFMSMSFWSTIMAISIANIIFAVWHCGNKTQWSSDIKNMIYACCYKNIHNKTLCIKILKLSIVPLLKGVRQNLGVKTSKTIVCNKEESMTDSKWMIQNLS